MFPGGIGHSRPAHHPGQFFHSRITGQRVDPRDGSSVRHAFFNPVLMGGEGGDLRQVRYT